MRIRNIKITQWRHFENVELVLEENTGLVCLVGANGTGKSHLLELIAAFANMLGLSPGVEIPRGNPFSDPHDFSLQIYLAEGVSPSMDEGLPEKEGFQDWDRTITIEDSNIPGHIVNTVLAGGISDISQSMALANWAIKLLRQSKDVHFLSLDADRAYPKKNININEVAQAYDIDWKGTEYTRGRSYKTTSTLYDEWIKFFLAQENQYATRLMQEMRRAKKLGVKPPEFKDHFEKYASSLQQVLPHLHFIGVDLKKRTLVFDTTGLELSFDQLSGGEREIAFLVGQIDRFGLRQGLFMLDEPELHLNADLIRKWVAYLTSTVLKGQIWFATHSLEAVEASGQQATFVLEKNTETRKVNSLARLDTRPVLSALSRAVGTPAFSISQLVFIFIEGEAGVGEREKYSKLAGMPQDVRFMECGSCNEVLRRVLAIKSLADESASGIRIGGIIDRDFRSDTEASTITNANGVLVLPVHEIENFFLHPAALSVFLHQHGNGHLVPLDIIREAADRRAGSWIFQHAMVTSIAKSLDNISLAAKERAKAFTWADFDADQDATIQTIVDVSGYSADDLLKFKSILEISVRSYSRMRTDEQLWKVCEGKQVLNDIARIIGFRNASTMIQATFASWISETIPIPDELIEFRTYLTSL